MTLNVSQELLFVLGKGGVGRTTVAAAMGSQFAASGEKVLLVQWAFHDAISAVFGLESTGHAAQELMPNLFVMNFSVEEAMREYFVSHLQMRTLYEFVVNNSHVQRLIRAVPGIHELFFLGRLFWLVELCQEERGWRYDRVIVDAPATGHGVALFSLPKSIASFGIAGPLAFECRRVSELLDNRAKVGTVVVTLPEELPVEESLELVEALERATGRPPLFVCVNRCLDHSLAELGCSCITESADSGKRRQRRWLKRMSDSLTCRDNEKTLMMLFDGLCRRRQFESFVREEMERRKLDVVPLPDIHFRHPKATPREVALRMAESLVQHG